MALKDVCVARLDPGRFQAVLDPDDCGRFLGRLEVAAERLAGRRLWQVNSTEQGGGVAEMLHFLVGYLAGADIDARWVVLEGNQDFFAVTKRVHHLLHGQPGDGGELDELARASYRQTLKETLGDLEPRVEPGDVVVLHDPQTAGLVPALKQQGATVIWSCHVGIDQPNDLARTAWEFLRPSVQQADATSSPAPPTAGRGWIERGWPSSPPASTPSPPRTSPWSPRRSRLSCWRPESWRTRPPRRGPRCSVVWMAALAGWGAGRR